MKKMKRTEKKLLKNKMIIISTALNTILKHLNTEQQKSKEWIYKELDDALNNLQIEIFYVCVKSLKNYIENKPKI